MHYEETGKLIRGVGGLYEILLDAGETPLSGKRVASRAKGQFRHEGVTPLVGDCVRVSFDDAILVCEGGEYTTRADGGGVVIDAILPRKNALIRPPMANLDYLFITLAAARPAPVLETVDKLISIAEYNGIEPVLVIGKSDIDPEAAERIRDIYTVAGFSLFVLSALAGGSEVERLRAFIGEHLRGKTAAFAGASGVGKSTLMNALFEGFSLETGEVSSRIERGRHTTRRVDLYPLAEIGGFVADTPGFSMLDFVRFDFFTRDDLFGTMREFAPYLGDCRYKKCTHTREEGCAILAAVKRGEIPKSRHESFASMYDALKNKHEWSKKK